MGLAVSLGLSGDSLLLLRSQNAGTSLHLRVRVEANHNAEVLERVLLLAVVAAGASKSGAKVLLNLIRVDDSGDVRVGHDVLRKLVAGLGHRGASGGTVHLVGALEGSVSPDNEAAKVTTRSKLEKVKAIDVSKIHTRKVAEGLDNAVVFSVDDEGSTALDVTAVAGLTGTSADLARVARLLDISVGTDRLEGGNGLLSLGDTLNTGDNEGDLGDLSDLVTTGHDEGREGSCSDSRNHSVALLVLVDLHVPSAPGLGGTEHATLAAHVTEGSLTSTRSTTTADTGDTGDGTTSTPRVGRVLVSSAGEHGVSLTTVLVHGLVHEGDNVRTDRSQEDIGETDLVVLSVRVLDGNHGASGSHCCR
jgi:hypothetical protein